jgi:regulator of protease activity HflC (stomatin/prohibitin superfamily)
MVRPDVLSARRAATARSDAEKVRIKAAEEAAEAKAKADKEAAEAKAKADKKAAEDIAAAEKKAVKAEEKVEDPLPRASTPPLTAVQRFTASLAARSNDPGYVQPSAQPAPFFGTDSSYPLTRGTSRKRSRKHKRKTHRRRR